MSGPTPIKDLRPGHYVMVDDEPCKVLSMTKSKPGKHGAAKARVEVVGLFDNRKRLIMRPASATAVVPNIEKRKAQVISVSGDIAQLMDMEEYTTFEAKIPETMKAQAQPGSEISYWKVNERILLRE